jgi:3-oxoacyl-[acyl-carrier protein] reductase
VKLEGRVALVTGASRGIGRAIALALADEGADVAVNYRSRPVEAESVVAAIRQRGRRAIAIGADVSSYVEVEALVAKTISELGGLHVLVNNAGIARDRLIANMTAEDWLEVMKVNFGGVFNCTRVAMHHLMGQRDGSIINISSVMAERGWVGEANYAASKGAVNSFTRCCAMELARFGVRVNVVLAGMVPTELVGGLMAKDEGRGVLNQIPVRQFATTEDIAKVAVFLAGPDAGYLTGSLVTVDGGASNVLGVGAPLR